MLPDYTKDIYHKSHAVQGNGSVGRVLEPGLAVRPASVVIGYVPPTEPQRTVWRRFWGNRAIIITSMAMEIYIVIAENYKNNIHIVSYTYAAFRPM